MSGKTTIQIGQRFGRLIVVKIKGRSARGKLIWSCRCDCGKTHDSESGSLHRGGTKSCGCLRDEVAKEQGLANRKHGHVAFIQGKYKQSPTYKSWSNMIQRCTNPRNNRFRYYGGALKPVRICKRWLVFTNFLKDMGIRPKGSTLGRFGDVGNYTKSNCRWQTSRQQQIERETKDPAKAARNLLGKVFGRLTAIELKLEVRGTRLRRLWRCMCSCGNEKTIFQDHLLSGATESCGCLRRKLNK